MMKLKKTIAVVGVVAMGLAGASALAQDRIEGGSPLVGPAVEKQLQILAREKAARTPAQRKLGSQLLQAIKASRGEPLAGGLRPVMTQAQPEVDGTVAVDIKAQVTPALLAEIEKLGGRVLSSYEEYGAIRAQVPLESLETLAGEEEVRSVRPAVRAFLNKVNTSEGDVAHAAVNARTKYGLKGKGVKVGVFSDSVDYLGVVQGAGDLPAVTVIEDDPGNSGEGTAMLEIVHDLAPEAQLYFATAWKSAAGFANNIKKLADAGCKVIVDDVGYLDESPFQDGIIAQAVNAATARGVLYFSAAGNSGNLNDGTSGAWEGDYRAMPSQVQGYQTMHDFGGGDWANRILFDGTGCYTLFWSDPLNGSANDYDLFLVDPTLSTIEGWSDEIQDGSQDPFEGFCALPGVDLTNYHILVAKYQGEDRFLHLSANRGEFERATDGQISGHPAAQDAFAVSAVSAANRAIPFVGNERVETFTSDGPRRVFYYPNGTPITPGNFSATGGMVREKPDITAADGVRTLTPGFNPFYGTSAAAPHAAAIGALMLSGRPGLTLTEVRNAFRKAALDIEAPGDWDRDSGYGIIRADLVLQETGPFARLSPGIINYLLRD